MLSALLQEVIQVLIRHQLSWKVAILKQTLWPYQLSHPPIQAKQDSPIMSVLCFFIVSFKTEK